jgi:hypothetical protein
MLGIIVNVLMVAVIIAGLVQLVRDWRKGDWEHEDWTSGDRKLVRTMRMVMCGSVAVAWALALVAIAHRPDLIHEPVEQRHHGSVADNRFCVEWE